MLISNDLNGIQLARQLMRMLETCPAAIIVADTSGIITQASDWVEPVLGRTARDLIGKRLDSQDLSFVHPDGSPLAPHERPMAIALRDNAALTEVEVGYFRHGSLAVLSCNVTPLSAEDGTPIGVAASFHDVTAYRHTEQVLRAGEQLFRQFVENTPAAVAMFDTQMRYMVASKRWRTDYHLGDQNFIGRSHYEVFPDIPDRWKEIHSRCLAGAVESMDEDAFVRADGSVEWIKWEIQPWRNEAGAIAGIIMFTEVITERKRQQEALRESQHYINSVIDSLSAHVAILNEEGVIQYTNRAWQRFAVDNGLRMPPDTIGVNYLTVCDEAVGEGADEAAAAALGIRDVIQGRRTDFSMEYNLSFEDNSSYYNLRVTRMADRTPVQVITAHEDITPVKTASQALRESEEKHRLLVERANDGIVVIQDLDIKFVNRQFALMGGFTVEELVNHRFTDFLPPEVLPSLLERYTRRLSGEEVPSIYETVLQKKTGEKVYVEINAGVVPYEGRPADLVFVRDITERKLVAEALRESEEKYRTLVENASDAIVMIQDGLFRYANQRFSLLTGHHPEEVIDTSYTRFVDPDELAAVVDAHKRRLAGEDVPPYQTKLIHRDGRTIYVEISGALVQYQGRPAAMIIGRDITDRVRAQEALENKTYQMEAVLDALPDLYFRLDAECRVLEYHAGVETQFYAAPERIVGSLCRELLPQDAARKVQEAVLKVMKTGEVVTTEYSLPHADGEHFYESRLATFGDSQVVMIERDITDRKRAEDEISESETRYRELVENISDWVWAVDREGRYTYSSPAIERMLGYTPDEMIGKSFLDTIVEEEKEDNLRAFEQTVTQGGDIAAWPNRNVHKDGSIRYLETSGSCVFNEQGECIGMRGIDRDVTERHIGEEEKRSFYRTAIFSLTDGKLNIVTAEEAAALAGSPDLRLEVADFREASSARTAVRDLLLNYGLSEERLSAFIIAVGEAINNSVKHAGSGTVLAGLQQGIVRVTVCDEGPGIEQMSLPRVALQRGFSTKPSLGLGYSIILDSSDRVFLYTGSEGTRVIMEKAIVEPAPMAPLLDLLPDTW